MKHTVFLAALLIIIQSCCHKLYPQKENTVEHYTTITETVRDTVVRVQPDSSIVEALIECDSTGRARLAEIQVLKESSRIQQSVTMGGNVLRSAVKVDSLGIYLQLKDKYKEEVKTETIETIIEKPVNHLTWWQKFLVFVGLDTLAVLFPLFLFKLLNKRKW